jgi:hypothetical protein
VYENHPDFLSIGDIQDICQGLLDNLAPSGTLRGLHPLEQDAALFHYSCFEYFYRHIGDYFSETQDMITKACTHFLRLAATAIRLHLADPVLLALGGSHYYNRLYGRPLPWQLDTVAQEHFAKSMLAQYPGDARLAKLAKSNLPMGFSIFDDLVECWQHSGVVDELLKYALEFVWIHAQKSKECKPIAVDLVFSFPELYFLQWNNLLPTGMTARHFAAQNATATKRSISEYMTTYTEERLETHAEKMRLILQQRGHSLAFSNTASSSLGLHSNFWSEPDTIISSLLDVGSSILDDLNLGDNISDFCGYLQKPTASLELLLDKSSSVNSEVADDHHGSSQTTRPKQLVMVKWPLSPIVSSITWLRSPLIIVLIAVVGIALGGSMRVSSVF